MGLPTLVRLSRRVLQHSAGPNNTPRCETESHFQFAENISDRDGRSREKDPWSSVGRRLEDSMLPAKAKWLLVTAAVIAAWPLELPAQNRNAPMVRWWEPTNDL